MDIEFQPVKVGIYDTMFDTDNKDLKDAFKKLWNNPEDENGSCNVTKLYSDKTISEEEKEEIAHGSHVAGLICAEAANGSGITGISQNAYLYGFSFYADSDDTGNVSQWGDLFEIEYSIAVMLNEGVKAINLSIGYDEMLVAAQNGAKNALKDLETYSGAMETFLSKCLDAGYDFLIVQSSGNANGYHWVPCEANREHPYGYKSDGNSDGTAGYDAQYDFLGAIEDENVKKHILIVGAAENQEGYYSTAFFSVTGNRVDVYAPGVRILSDKPNNITGMMDGTSMATPIVTGTVSLVWGVNPELGAVQVADIIRASTSVTLFDSEKVSNFFHRVDTTPIINAYFAVQLAQNTKTEGVTDENHFGIITGMAYTTGTDGFADALNGAMVTITDAEGAVKDTAVSSKDSGFAFVLPAGSYTVQAKAEGYNPVSQKISLKEGEVKNINLELKASGIELTDYYSNISSLIEKAGLRQEADPLNTQIVYSSEKTKIYFMDSSMKQFMVSNTDPGISVYGIKTGDSKDRIVSVFAEYGHAIPSTSMDGRMNVYLWDEAGLSDVICVSFTFDETGNVSQWYAVNWPEGEIASFYIPILLQAHDTGVTSFADWQIAYFNFLDHNYQEHDMDNQYECTLIYINDDDIPELYIEYGSTASGSLLAYFNGSEVVTLPMYTYGLTYIERENRFRDSGGHMDTYYDAVYAIEENGFREIASGNYGAADNSRVETDADGNPIYEYYWNDRKTTEEGYGQALEKVFDSDSAVSPFGKYDSVAHMDGGFYSLWEIGDQILSAGM